MNMKKAAALLIAAFLAASISAGCSDKKQKTDNNDLNAEDILPSRNDEPVAPIGSTVLNGEIGKEITANNTSFTLKSVIISEDPDNDYKFVYFDIDLRNSTNNAYTLSTLNNFYIKLSDDTDIYSDVLSQLNAENQFKTAKYFVDPFDIPSNGQFSGIIGGFTVNKSVTDFTVCFFPTGSNPNDKGTVIKFPVTTADLCAPDQSVLK